MENGSKIKADTKLNVPDFNDLKVTTSVIVKRLEGNINLPVAFTCLPITKIEVDTDPKTKAIVIPHCPIIGTIYSLNYLGEIRGLIIKSAKGKNFKNSMIVDMSISDKNVNYRLSIKTIHICGIKDIRQADETADLLIDHIVRIQEELDFINQNKTRANEIIAHIENNITQTGNKLIIYNSLDDRIFKFYCRNLKDHSSIDSFLTELKWLASQDHIYRRENDKPLRVCKTETSMINYNYNLGFKINRNAAFQELKCYKGMDVNYDNMIVKYIEIKIPFDIPEDSGILRKNKKDGPAKITIILYKSGNVTLSGVSFDINKKVYNRFNEIMAELKPIIEAGSINIIRRDDTITSTTEELIELRASEITQTS